MNIKAGLNKDTPLELLPNDSICQAKNIIVSNDLETILAENAIKTEFDLSIYGDIAGHIDCPTEIVLFFKNNKIIRYNSIDKNVIDVDAKWKWCGGEVFGTYTYNVKKELIVAVSERNADVDVPLKIINIDISESNINEDYHTLFPEVPIALCYASSDNNGSMKIGTYSFFIRYSINEEYKTNWFPLGNKIHLFNSNNVNNLNTIIKHHVQILPKGDSYVRGNSYDINLSDLYCEDKDTCNKHIVLSITINDKKQYNKFEIGYICNSKGGAKAYKTNYYDLNDIRNRIINLYGDDEIYNIDDLTIDNIDVINVNTMCNYKNRLYIGDFKEKNRNKDIKLVDTKNITIEVISSSSDSIWIDSTDDFINNAFLPCTCYQFFLHYVWKNGSVSDGILIDDASNIVDDLNIFSKDAALQKYYNVNNEAVYYLGAIFNRVSIKFNNIPKINDAVGCFISCAKIEHSFIGQGVLTQYETEVADTEETSGESFSAYKAKARYPEFNILGGNSNITHCILTGELSSVKAINNSDFTAIYDLNISKRNNNIEIVKSLVIAPDSTNNEGREGFLSVEFKEQTTIYNNDVYYFISYTKDNFKNKYNAKTKTLIKIGDITNFNTNACDIIIDTNRPCYLTSGSYYRTKEYGYYISTTSSVPSTNDFNRNENNEEVFKFYYVENHIFPVFSTYPLAAKQLNVPPEIIFYNYNIYKNKDGKLEVDSTYQLKNYIVQAANLNSLFKLDVSYYNYIEKIYQNYDKDKDKDIYITNKTIRRSDIIADESTDINWRYFRPENYKVITENKGAVKNVVSAGTYLLVHCEHSLFAFDVNNVMKTDDKDVQLTMPDVFDVNYKEVFTAEQGFGGLHDNTSWIFNEHGYIFYDYSAKRFYRFDDNQLIDINNFINSFIKHIDFNNVIFGYDKPNNRCIVGLKKDNNIVNTISYNYKINNWISEHDYENVINYANVKDKLYFITNDRTLITYSYNEFNKNINKNIDSYIDILFADTNENRIKVLNYITYIINKEYVDTYNELKLKVYTDTCVTDWVSLLKERNKVTDYKSPVYDYDKWNINYFRNIAKDIHNNNDIINRITGEFQEIPTIVKKGIDNALMVGKYFVVRFVFSNNNKQTQIKDIQAYFK